MQAAAKAWAATVVTPIVVLIMYFMSQTETVAQMPDEVQASLGALVLALVGGFMGLLVYLVPNTPRQG
jgi:hypothetical protein